MFVKSESEKLKEKERKAAGVGPAQSGETASEEEQWDSKVIDLRRVTRVVAGGKRFKFRATVILGNSAGKVGTGTAKGEDVAQAVAKASHQARRHVIEVPLDKGTIPHEVSYKYGPSRVLLKPAPLGAGVIAGGAVRMVAGLAGIKNISGKILSRSNNQINNARATLGALGKLKKSKASAKAEA